MEEKVIVEFARAWRNYRKGERAGFSPAIAEDLKAKRLIVESDGTTFEEGELQEEADLPPVSAPAVEENVAPATDKKPNAKKAS